MAVKTLHESAPVREPAPPSSPCEPASDPLPVFMPSTELGEQLQHLRKAQAEIDRRKAEELARLREIQNRD